MGGKVTRKVTFDTFSLLQYFSKIGQYLSFFQYFLGLGVKVWRYFNTFQGLDNTYAVTSILFKDWAILLLLLQHFMRAFYPWPLAEWVGNLFSFARPKKA
jgi:hypothetical protein